MNRRRVTMLFTTLLIVFGLVGYTDSLDSIGINLESLLQQILSDQRSIHEEINQLKTRSKQQDQIISNLQKQLDIQHSRFSGLEKTTRLSASKKKTSPQDLHKAKELYDNARAFQHNVIFNIRKGKQRPLFRKVVEDFRIIVQNHPHAPETADAQLRIARTLLRYLDDVEQAKIEFHKLLTDYPTSSEADEAQKALNGLP